MMCEERAGFLFAHACDQMSVWSCSRCTKPICAAHTRTTGQGQACIACARAIESEQGTERRDQDQKPDDQQPTDRQTYSDTDDPYFYRRGPSGSREHYDADDRRAFDSSANQEPEGSWEQDPAGS